MNLSESKIMLFRNEGRTGNIEKWKIGGKLMDVVNRYKYFGVTLTP